MSTSDIVERATTRIEQRLEAILKAIESINEKVTSIDSTVADIALEVRIIEAAIDSGTD